MSTSTKDYNDWTLNMNYKRPYTKNRLNKIKTTLTN